MAFEKGDIVVANPDEPLNKGNVSERLKLMLVQQAPATVIGTFAENGQAYVRIEVELDGMKSNATFYAKRMMLLKQDIVENCFVRCLDPRRSSILAKGSVYKVVAMVEKDGEKFVRVASNKREIRHAFPVEMFAFSSMKAPKDWDVVIVEPWEKKLLNELAKGEHKGICSFAIMYEAAPTDFHRDAPCHAALGYEGGNKKIKALALCFSRFYNQYNDERKAGYKRFLNWLVNESSMKGCFIPRSADDLVKNGVLMNLNKSNDEVAVAAVASRHYSEFSAKAVIFDEVMDMGFEGNVAMFVSTFFDKKGDDMVFNAFGGGHHFLSNTLDYQSIFSFFKNGFDPALLSNPNKPMHEGSKGYKILRSVAKLSGRIEYEPGATSVSAYVAKLKGVTSVNAGAFGGNVLKMTGKNSLIRLCAAVSKEV